MHTASLKEKSDVTGREKGVEGEKKESNKLRKKWGKSARGVDKLWT